MATKDFKIRHSLTVAQNATIEGNLTLGGKTVSRLIDSDEVTTIINNSSSGFDSDQVVAIINENTSPDIVARLDSDEIKIQAINTDLNAKIDSDSARIDALAAAGVGLTTFAQVVHTFTTTQPTTIFTGADDDGDTLSYTVGKLQVYLNGLLLTPGASKDYTATNGTSVVLTEASDSEDVITIVKYLGAADDILTQKYVYKVASSGNHTPFDSEFTGADENGNVLSYTPNKVQVFLNGILLQDSDDYIANNGSTITLLAAPDSDDVLVVYRYLGTQVTGFDSDQVVAIINENLPVDQTGFDSDQVVAIINENLPVDQTGFDSDQVVAIINENSSGGSGFDSDQVVAIIGENTTTVTGGNAITVTSGVVNHNDTSSQASVNNSGSNFIQDITLDTYGHVTAITSAAAAGGDPYVNVNSTGTAASATGTDAIAIGETAVAGGSDGIAIGSGAYAYANQDNISIGKNTMSGNTGSLNVAIGREAARNSGNADSGVYVGHWAGDGSTGHSSTFLGYAAGINKTGVGNTAIGYQSMAGSGNGSLNAAVGRYSLRRLTSGYDNVAVGDDAGQNITTGYYNTMIGKNCGANVSTGYGNIAIGRFADTGNNDECIIIGYNAKVSNQGQQSGQNGQVVLGSSLQGKGANTAFIKGPAYQSNNSSSWTTTSDERVKTNITDYTLGLDALSQVNVKTFNYRSDSDIATNSPELADSDGLVHEGLDTEKTDIGIIAQELELILPNTITTRDNGMKSVNKDELFWVMLNSIKELKTANDSLVARVEALENA